MTRVFLPAYVAGDGKLHPMFVKTEYDGRRLSVSGVIGPQRNGGAWGAAGQIDSQFLDYDARGWLHLTDLVIHDPWTLDGVRRLFDIWQRWHLNDMRAGCEHQRADGWDKRPIDLSKPLTAYGRHFPGQLSPSWNMLVWVTRKEHPAGLLSEPCPVCGYRYGSAWRTEPVPERVITELAAMPASDVTPAWV